jgi:hypothetical protein
MSEDKSNLPSENKSKKEEQDILPKVLVLAPLLALILQVLELILKILGVIN